MITRTGLVALVALGTVLLSGCPAEEKKTDTTSTTTTTTTTTSAAPSTGTTSTDTTSSSTTTTTTGGPSSGPTAPSGVAGASSKPGSTRTTLAANAAIDAKAIFSQKCAGCHGANGGGGMGPSLQHVAAKGDAFIHTRIMKGSATKGMPAFGDSGMLKAPEVDALVAYVKTL